MSFRTADGAEVPAVTAAQMREVDRAAVDEFGLGILQMMENAGRNLALHAIEMLGGAMGVVTVCAGGGGNGGGGLCAARHLRNRGYAVRVVLDRGPNELGDAAANQMRILRAAGLKPIDARCAQGAIQSADLVLDALIGYNLRGAPRGRTAALIALCNAHANRVLALDLPSGLDATTGEAPGVVIRAERTLTLALPKTGLFAWPGEIYLADIGIPPEVYRRIGIEFEPPFGARSRGRHNIELTRG